MLEQITGAFPNQPASDWKIYLTGSGAGAPLRAHRRQVRAGGERRLARGRAPAPGRRQRHRARRSGREDHHVQEERATGEKTAIASMNDKCASGTGATIDKCFLKVNAPPELVTSLHFDDSKLHHVAAKCGVFAETDIVNLIKSGIPSNEVLCSLADAIVLQNLSVLTRGGTLKHRVLLLGGPNTYLPFLQECWRLRIPQTWDERGYAYPKDVPIEETIFVPKNAQYYAAQGAVLFGMHEADEVGNLANLDHLREYITTGRKARLGESAGPPLSKTKDELAEFRETYAIPKFVPATFDRGRARARRHRPGRRVDVEQGGARRLRERAHPREGVPALEGQPDPGHEGAPQAAPRLRRGGPEGEARGHGLRRDRVRGRRARAVRRQRREHRRDGRAHDERRALLRGRRRRLRHRRAGHQGPLHEERGHRELPPVEQLLGRQRDAPPGHGRLLRRARHSSSPTSPSRPSSRRSSRTDAPSSSTPTA